MSDHDPLCEFGEHSPIPIAFHLEPRHCRCDLIAQVREDERKRIWSKVNEVAFGGSDDGFR